MSTSASRRERTSAARSPPNAINREVEKVGLRELRQNASDLVRRVQEGEEITITVAGRPGARLVPAVPRAWRQWEDVADVFMGPADPDWNDDRQTIDHEVRDPWARH